MLQAPLKNRLFYLIAGALLLVLVSLMVVISGFGSAYRQSLMNVASQKPNQEPSLGQKKTVRRISVRKNGEKGCLEITPDGAVRVYSQCGSQLESAGRLTDTKNIIKLFRLVSETELTATPPPPPPGGEVYELTVETDSGSQVVYVVTGPVTTPSPSGDIAETINQIQGDLPTVSPTPAPGTESPAPTGILISPTPTPGGSAPPSLTPSPAPTSAQPFSCDFGQGTGGKRPLNISNTLCTTQPTPGP